MAEGAALITGASFGVGRATALALAKQGRDVVVTATRAENLSDTLAALKDTGVRAMGLPLDLNDPEAPEACLAEALDAVGRIDVLVNNAATTQRKPATEVTRADWQSIMAVNLEGTFFLSTAFARHCQQRGQPGSIVNVASTHGLKGSSDLCLYALSKGAIVHLTKLLAIEWAPDNIRVNAVAPGRMLTESPARASSASDPEFMEKILKRVPLGRVVAPAEVAAAVAFLTGPETPTITGEVLVIDGGQTVK